jgi:hypothetical protein
MKSAGRGGDSVLRTCSRMLRGWEEVGTGGKRTSTSESRKLLGRRDGYFMYYFEDSKWVEVKCAWDA